MKNTIKVLLIVSIILLIICIIGLSILIFIPEPDNKDDLNKDKLTHGTISEIILSETQDAGEEYIDRIYFVGDSTTYHFFKGGVDKSHILVPESLTLMLSSDILSVEVGSDGLTIPQALKKAKAEIVIITIGVNGADNFTEVKYKTYYKKLINAIKDESPDIKIILQSVFPVTKDYSDQDKGITNAGINRLNEWCKEIALETGAKYLDTQSILKDAQGAQKVEYNEEDGVHMNSAAYEAILLYIRTHALK